MTVAIVPIADAHVESFHRCLDAVARERRYLAMLEAPPLGRVREFVRDNIEKGVSQVVALSGDTVVGWCDILPAWHETLRHGGSLGMGLLPAWRGQGLGERLFRECLVRAVAAGVTRVELEARADNERALALYRRLGFVVEGTKARGMRVEGRYYDTVAMAFLVPDAPLTVEANDSPPGGRP